MYCLFFSVQLCLKFSFAAQGNPYELVVKDQYAQVLPIHTLLAPICPAKRSSMLILDKRYQLPAEMELASVGFDPFSFYTVVHQPFHYCNPPLYKVNSGTAFLRGPPPALV